jgi:hypothetical protein
VALIGAVANADNRIDELVPPAKVPEAHFH